MKHPAGIVLLLILIFFFPGTNFGQDQWHVARLSGDIKFDGKPDDPAWKTVDPFPFITLSPTYGKVPGQKTEIRLAYNDQYIYLGAAMFVHDPAMIRAIGKVRDFTSMTCDWIGLQLDTYNDNQNSVFFFTNPNGVRYDGTISNDGTPAEKEPLDLNWDTFWDVKTVIEDTVWYAEMRIPVSSLRFKSDNDKTVMGFNVARYVAANNEIYIYPDTPDNWGSYSQVKPSTYADGIFEGIEPRKPLYISPYLLTGIDQSYNLNGEGTSYVYEPHFKLEPGLDVKYGLNTNTTLDLTVNTDFAQVEADAQQFNLTRFSLVYPEKRKFFLERANVFDFGMGGPNTLFYSRKIGLYNGNPVRILGGARMMSSANGWDLGVMDLQTAAYQDDLPSENFGVFRVKKSVLNSNSYMGGMFTSRVGIDGTYNIAYGLDALLRILGDEYLTIRWAQSFKDNTDAKVASLDPARIYLDWTRRRDKGLSYSLLYVRSGVDFDPGIGLEVFDNYYVYEGIINYTFISPDESKIQRHTSSVTTYTLNDVRDNALLSYKFLPSWMITSKNGWVGSASLEYNHEYLKEDFIITDSVNVPNGIYNFWDINLSANTPGSWAFKLNASLCAGQYYDGIRISPQFNPTWNISGGLELGATYVFDYLNFSSRNRMLANHIVGIRGLYMLSTRISFSGFIQYNTAIHSVISNIRLRYNPKEGTDLYLVFNEGRNTYLDREIPVLPSYYYRSIMLKYTYTFNL